jgi:hypothetical protein
MAGEYWRVYHVGSHSPGWNHISMVAYKTYTTHTIMLHLEVVFVFVEVDLRSVNWRVIDGEDSRIFSCGRHCSLGSKTNVVKTMPCLPPMTGNGLHNLKKMWFMVILGMVYYCFNHTRQVDAGCVMWQVANAICTIPQSSPFLWVEFQPSPNGRFTALGFPHYHSSPFKKP